MECLEANLYDDEDNEVSSPTLRPMNLNDSSDKKKDLEPPGCNSCNYSIRLSQDYSVHSEIGFGIVLWVINELEKKGRKT